MPVHVLMRSFAFVALFGALALSLLSGPAAAKSTRVALVIGNGGYEFVEALPNPIRDAADVADTLDELGFDVTLGIDLDRRKFDKLIDRFVSESAGATDVVFYYAGHGFQLGSKNHLVPVNASLRDRETINDETFILNDVIARLQAENRQMVVILDACRNNPLPEQLRGDDTAQGLAEIDTGRDLYVVFATEPGKFALDGQGRNSPFTKALLTHMRRPGLSISEIMVDLRRDVFTETEGAQLPWDQSSLRSQFSFAPKQAYTEKLASAAKSGTAAQSGTANAQSAESSRSTDPRVLEPADAETLESIEETRQNAKPAAEAPAAEETQKVASSSGQPDAETIPDETEDLPAATAGGGGSGGIAKKPDEAEPETQQKSGDEPQPAVQKQKKPPVAKPPVVKQREKPKPQKQEQAQARGKRPSPMDYSYKVWPHGKLLPGKRFRKSTPYGVLSCKGMIDENWFGAAERIRMCRWE